MIQLSHPYMTTGKTIALTRQTFVSKIMSLLFNMLSRLVRSMAERSYHSPEVRAVARRSNPTSKEQQLLECRRAKRSYYTFKVRRGRREETPLVQGKEQQLCFAGAAMKRYPTSKVRETQVRW